MKFMCAGQCALNSPPPLACYLHVFSLITKFMVYPSTHIPTSRTTACLQYSAPWTRGLQVVDIMTMN